MIPSQTILNSLQTLLADDTGSLGAAAVKHVHLIMAPFTPSPTTDFTALTEATFTGSTKLSAPAGNQSAFRDPGTGQLVVEMIPPAGGWHWQATAGANLPQTIYGWALTDLADAVTFGSGLLPAPITLAQTGDGVDIPAVRFNFIPPVMQ
jgi:hypothetical protein